MSGLRTGLALLILAEVWVVIVGSTIDPEDYVSTLLKGIRELEDLGTKHLHELRGEHLEDLLSAGSEVKDLNAGSREELEEDKGQNPDASASQETDNKEGEKPASKEEPEDIDEDEDDDGDDETGLSLFPVRGLFNFFGMTKPWWTGPNVCIERDEKEEKSEDSAPGDFISFGSAHFSNCFNSPYKYTCKTITKRNGVTKTSIVSYQCCHGFRRSPKNFNCTKVETKPVLELAKELGSDKFADLVRSSGLESEAEGKVTIFLPSDAALDDHHQNMDSLNSVDPILTNDIPLSGQAVPRNGKAFVLGHIVDGVFEIGDLSDEQVLRTLDNSTLRVNFLPGGAGVTVNCAKLNATDQLTENGVVHVVESVMEPAHEPLSEMLSEGRFSLFKQLLEENGLWEIMSGDKPLTVFAVENEAIEKISSRRKMCMKNILAHHILPHTLCSAMGDSGERLATLDLARGWLPFTRRDGDFIIGNSTKVTSADRVATNGLLHVAEDVVVPSGARSVFELLNQTEHKEWLSLLEKSGLLDEIETTENMTMFVPTDSAVKDADLSSLSDSEIQDLVRYHIGKTQSGSSVSTLIEGQNLTISAEKSVFPGLVSGGRYLSVQCVPVTRVGGRVCNGLLHEVGSVLRPPTQNLWDYLQGEEQLTTLRKVLEGTKLEEELKSGLGFTATLLAPTDSSFEDLGKENLDSLLTDKELADQVLRAHILKEPVCCSNAVPSTWPFVSTSPTLASGRPAEVNRRGNVATFSSLQVTDCDHVVKDGIVHLVSGVRLGRPRTPDRALILRRPDSEIILAGL